MEPEREREKDSHGKIHDAAWLLRLRFGKATAAAAAETATTPTKVYLTFLVIFLEYT